MKLKRIIAALTAATMVLGLVACGGGTTVDKDGSNKNGSDLDWSAGADASGGDVTIRVTTWRTNDKAYYEEIVKRFEEKYDWITVKLDITGEANSYYANLQADLGGGTGPDVFDSHPGRLSGYIDSGLLAPQTDFDYLKNYSEDAKRITGYEGENYAFMNAYNYFGFLYNKAAFEKAGVSAPTTPEELFNVVNKLKQAGYGGIVYPGQTNGSTIANAAVMIALGQEGYTAMKEGIDNGSITDLSEVEGVEEALNTIQDYITNDVFYTAWEGISTEAGMSLYAQEKAAIAYAGTYMFGENSVYFPNIDTGFFPIPTYANTGLSYMAAAQSSCINKASKNLGAAKLWVEFLATQEIREYYCTNAKMFSSIEGVTPTFPEAEMILSACKGYVSDSVSLYDNVEYWQSGYNGMLEGVLKGKDWKGLVKVYASKLEEYDLGSLQ